MQPEVEHIPWAETYPEEEEVWDYIYMVHEFLGSLIENQLTAEQREEVVKLYRQAGHWIEYHTIH